MKTKKDAMAVVRVAKRLKIRGPGPYVPVFRTNPSRKKGMEAAQRFRLEATQRAFENLIVQLEMVSFLEDMVTIGRFEFPSPADRKAFRMKLQELSHAYADAAELFFE